LVHWDENAAYTAMLLSGVDAEGEIQVHMTAYTKSHELQYVLHLSAPYVDETTIRDLAATQRLSIERILQSS
jgi:hypothetical protein